MLARYPWPGNVRELANVVERAVVLAVDGEIGLDLLLEEIVASTLRALPLPSADQASAAPVGYHQGVADAKRELIREALRQTGGHQTRAATLLGLTQPYLARLIKNLGLHGP